MSKPDPGVGSFVAWAEPMPGKEFDLAAGLNWTLAQSGT
jgi:hypothetical protein